MGMGWDHIRLKIVDSCKRKSIRFEEFYTWKSSQTAQLNDFMSWGFTTAFATASWIKNDKERKPCTDSALSNLNTVFLEEPSVTRHARNIM